MVLFSDYGLLGLLPLGLLAGLILGYVGRFTSFCFQSALEAYWYGKNRRGLDFWVLTITLTIALTQGLVFAGLIDPYHSLYLARPLNVWATIIGGTLFGAGMALVGTCGYGALIRLGSGSLKSLVALVVMALVALSTLQGPLATLRLWIIDLGRDSNAASHGQSLADSFALLVGENGKMLFSVLVVALLLLWLVTGKQVRDLSGKFLPALCFASLIAFGWLVIDKAIDDTLHPGLLYSTSFVGPLSGLFLRTITLADWSSYLGNYGLAMVVGVVMGSFLASKRALSLRWEACDDARELGRHLCGAALMGFGGIIALGCNIGQGLSAMSILAPSAPLSLISMALGSRLVTTWLLEGRLPLPFLKSD